MPHASLKLIAGVDQTRTPALNEAAISSSNLIRFMPDHSGQGVMGYMSGLPQKLGGWQKFYPQALGETVRVLWAWEDTNANAHLGIATDTTLNVLTGSTLQNISPQITTANVAISVSTTSGSSVVTITDTGSNIISFDSVYISTPITVGGLVLFGFYDCSALSADTYTIVARDVLGNPIAATSTVAGGGATVVFNSTSGSATITATLANHGYSVGSSFPVMIPTTVGGVTLSGNYTIISVPSTSTFTFVGPAAASSTATVTYNSGLARYTYYIGPGPLPGGSGFGIGGFGLGGFGTGVSYNAGRTFTTTAATASGTTATLSFAQNYYVPIGSTITVSGVTPTGFNGTWVTTGYTQGATSTVSFTTPTALSGPMTVAGTIVVTKWGFTNDGSTDWSLDNWGEDLIATREKGPIFEWAPPSGSPYATILSNAPIVSEGAFVAMPQRQIISYGSTFNGVQDPLLIRWCDVGNFTSWIGTVTNQAGSYRISKGSRIVGGLQAPQQSFIWTDIDLWSMQYTGQPYVYSFNEVGTGCGLIARKAATVLSGTVYWMSQSQFFMFSGSGLQEIPCPVWDVVFQQIDTNYLQNVIAAPNSRFGEVTWYFPTIGSGGVPSQYVKFNTLLNQWDFGTLTRTAWIDQSVLGAPIGAGGSNYIYQHETSPDADGQPMTASFTTGYFALSEGNNMIYLDQVWPDMKFGNYGQTASANVQITFNVVDYPGQTPRVYGPYTVTQATKFISPRFRGRLCSITISSSDIGSFWRLGCIRYRLNPDGKF